MAICTSSNDSDVEPKLGRPVVPFQNAAKRTKLMKTDDAVDFNKQKCNDLNVSYEYLLIYLLKRDASTRGDTNAAKFFGGLLENGIPTELKRVDPEKGFYIK